MIFGIQVSHLAISLKEATSSQISEFTKLLGQDPGLLFLEVKWVMEPGVFCNIIRAVTKSNVKKLSIRSDEMVAEIGTVANLVAA